ncbi:MAG: PD40 domain-containing protein [Sandaracinaceae bacterium]|nr:PD40 domain-containing protein [Sandaracinaceae bacterium]
MRGFSAIAVATLVLSIAVGAEAQAANDPRLVWHTITTPHYAVHYHEPLGLMARRVAVIAERANENLGALLHYTMHERTQIVLTDDTDSANGSANAVPYNTIRLYATAPEDLSPLDDYDDWMTAIVFHESTHIAHLDQVSGIATLINALLGKVYTPNAIAPRWFLEGLAVYEEIHETAGGRLRSTMWDMFMRADALQDRLLRLDQVSNDVDRWPHGNAWYLYGSHFVRYIARRHGDEALARIVNDYGGQALPYGLNRIAHRATGRTFVELYDDFLRETHEHYTAQADAVRARGLRAGRRLTFHGEDARTPRFLPDGHVVYHAADGYSLSELRVVSLTDPDDVRHLQDVSGTSSAAPLADGRSIVFSAVDTTRDIYNWNELFRLDLGTGTSERLTFAARAQEPDVSRDGRHVVYTMNNAGTTHLMIADLRDVPGTARRLVESAPFEQIYTPRYSPDGTRVAFSVWREGGYRDINVINVATGTLTHVTDDRALDTGPAWSPDSQTLYFSSDRTGIANIYAYKFSDASLAQVTNTLYGAYQPDVSPDGRTIVFIGYTSWGWDLYTIEADPAQYLEALPYIDERPAPSDTRSVSTLTSDPYNPLATILPRSYLLDVRPNSFGDELGISILGGDVVGFHSYSARMGIGLVRGEVNIDANYTYERSPFRPHLHFYRYTAARDNLFVGGEQRRWIESVTAVEVGSNYTFRRALSSDSISINYTLGNSAKAEPFTGTLDPNTAPPQLPEVGRTSQLRIGWAYSTLRRFSYDISTSEGAFLGVSAAWADPLIGSQYHATSTSWVAAAYITMPFFRNNVLALRYGGGISGGDPGRRAGYYVGGFPYVPLVDALLNQTILGGVALRGYAPYDRGGTQLHLFQVEYRFPIIRPQIGVATLPVYLNRMYGLVFADYGDAFSSRLDVDTFRLGVGGELLTDFTLGYYIGFTLRLGIARGVNDGGTTQFYANLGVPY